MSGGVTSRYVFSAAAELIDFTTTHTFDYGQGLVVSVFLLEASFSDPTAQKMARRMKEENPELRVIACSTMGSGQLPFDLPCDAVLDKPVNTKQVLSVVERLLQ